MIKKLRTSYLLPAELAETIDKLLKALVEVGMSDPFIAKIEGLLLQDISALQQTLTALRINSLVDNVAEADAIRDDLFIGFRNMIDAYKRLNNPAMLEAHHQLWPILEQAGTRLYALGYTEQSGKMQALFTEFDKPENQMALSTLNLTTLYYELKQAQNDFTTIYNDRLNEDTLKDFPTLKEAKGKAVAHVNILLDAIAILNETEPEIHVPLINKMNVITTEITAVAMARRSREENEEAEETDDTFPDPEDGDMSDTPDSEF